MSTIKLLGVTAIFNPATQEFRLSDAAIMAARIDVQRLLDLPELPDEQITLLMIAVMGRSLIEGVARAQAQEYITWNVESFEKSLRAHYEGAKDTKVANRP